MSAPVLRIAEISELSILSDIAHKTWPATYGSFLPSGQIEYMLKLMYDLPALEAQHKLSHQFIICSKMNQDVGFASFELNYHNVPSIKLHKLYILPEAQGQGIGKALINYIISKGLESMQKSIILNVNRSNRAVEFYKTMNFKPIKEEKLAIGDGFFMDDFIMELLLSEE